jgi:hypothetical protein
MRRARVPFGRPPRFRPLARRRKPARVAYGMARPARAGGVLNGSRLCEKSHADEMRRTLFFRWAIPTARSACLNAFWSAGRTTFCVAENDSSFHTAWVRNAPNGFGCRPAKIPTSTWAGSCQKETFRNIRNDQSGSPAARKASTYRVTSFRRRGGIRSLMLDMRNVGSIWRNSIMTLFACSIRPESA